MGRNRRKEHAHVYDQQWCFMTRKTISDARSGPVFVQRFVPMSRCKFSPIYWRTGGRKRGRNMKFSFSGNRQLPAGCRTVIGEPSSNPMIDRPIQMSLREGVFRTCPTYSLLLFVPRVRIKSSGNINHRHDIVVDRSRFAMDGTQGEERGYETR